MPIDSTHRRSINTIESARAGKGINQRGSFGTDMTATKQGVLSGKANVSHALFLLITKL
jgi:hypothetical protein